MQVDVAVFNGRQEPVSPTQFLIDTGLHCSIIDTSYFEEYIKPKLGQQHRSVVPPQLEGKTTVAQIYPESRSFAQDINGQPVTKVGEIHNLRLHMRGSPQPFTLSDSFVISNIQETTGQNILIGWDIFSKNFSIVANLALLGGHKPQPPEVVQGIRSQFHR